MMGGQGKHDAWIQINQIQDNILFKRRTEKYVRFLRAHKQKCLNCIAGEDCKKSLFLVEKIQSSKKMVGL